MFSPEPTASQPLSAALRQLLAPLVRLALGQGMTHAPLEELLKQALVQAVDDELQAVPPHRRVSRITTTTGIHRREVTRLLQVLREGGEQAAPAQRSHASELFIHWRTHAGYRDAQGQPLLLPRQGPAPSFESLAQAITRDVHPRSLLDELLRLGLVAVDERTDTVRLLRETFVPMGDGARLLGVLGRNVGAHLAAAVDNVLKGPGSHLEQAVFADGLSDASLTELRQFTHQQWQAVQAALVGTLETLVARDNTNAATAAQRLDPAEPRHRVRIGLYTYQQAQADATPAAAKPAPRKPS